MTPRQILATLAARWPWALAVLLVTVTATMFVSVTMLKRYTATASVMLDARSPEQVAGGMPNSAVPIGYMSTQMGLISSERVGREVIRALALNQDARLREAWQKVGNGAGDFEAWLSEAMEKNLSVKPELVSNVVTIAYTSDDREKAAKITNAYVKAYIDISLELRMERVRQYGGFFDERARELRANLERAQAKLSDHQQKNGLLVGDEKLNVEAARLAELSAQLLAAQSSNADVTSRLRHAGRQTDQLQEVWRNPTVAALNADITREEVRLRELTARLGDSHPQLIEQEARLTELRSRLAAEKAKAAENVGFDNTAARSRVSEISSMLESQRAKVLRMQAQREQSAALQRELESAQRAFEAMQARAGQASVESQNTYANVSILKHATVPMVPSSPNLLKNMAASLAFGAIAGMALVLGREFVDRRLRTVDDVAELKQVVLISLPQSAHRSLVSDTSRTQLMKERVLTGLPRPAHQPRSS